jgi:predicted nuclease of predicted toxin-antitoxin system
MGISPKTVAFLRTLGHDATHLQEQGLERLPDSAILAKARAEARILLTHDLGFGELVAASGARLPSVILFRLRNMQPDHANRYLNLVLSRHPTELAEGVVISVTEAQIRLRTLPVGPLF